MRIYGDRALQITHVFHYVTLNKEESDILSTMKTICVYYKMLYLCFFFSATCLYNASSVVEAEDNRVPAILLYLSHCSLVVYSILRPRKQLNNSASVVLILYVFHNIAKFFREEI